MKLQLFAVRDRQLDAFMTPWCAQSNGQAIRMFTDEINNKEGQLYKHAGDYDLYHVGDFNPQNGKVEGGQEPGSEYPLMISVGANVQERINEQPARAAARDPRQ